MFQPVSLFIGLRYSRSKSRTGFISFITFFSTVGILLGVASLITVVSVMNGFEGELKKRVLGIVPHVLVSNDNSQHKELTDWKKLREQLLQQEHIHQVTPLLGSEALIQSQQNLQGVMLQGIMPEFEQNNIISTNMMAGSLSSLSEHAYGIVIGRSLANKLQVSMGDKIRLVLPNKTIFTPMGRIPVQRKFTITGIFDVGSQVDDAMVYVHSKYGAKLLRHKGDGIEQLRLYLDDAFNAEKVVDKLTPIVNADSSLSKQIKFTTWNDSQGALFSAVSMEKKMMWLMLSLIVAVAAFNIVSALVMVVVEKQGEIGILQTLGLSKAGVVKIFITQGMVNGLWGVGLGSVFGVFLSQYLNNILALFGVNIFGAGYAMQELPIQLELNNVVFIAISALAMSFVATLYPAFQASNTQPAEVLRNE